MTPTFPQSWRYVRQTWRYGTGSRVRGFFALFILCISDYLLWKAFDAFRNVQFLFYLIGGLGLVLFVAAPYFAWLLITVVRTRISVDETTVRAMLFPLRGWIPRARPLHLRLNDIRSVERRTEIYRSMGTTTMQESLYLVTDTGRIHLLCNPQGSSNTLPLDEVADGIAFAAGVQITDGGAFRVQKFGLRAEPQPLGSEIALDPAQRAQAERSTNGTWQFLGVVIALTAILRACQSWGPN